MPPVLEFGTGAPIILDPPTVPVLFAPSPPLPILVEPAPPPAPPGQPAPPIVGAPAAPPVVLFPVIGPKGADGQAGGFSAIETLTAGETLSGQRVVATQSDGTVQYASNDELADTQRQLWLTLQAATAGDTLQCQAYGRITETGWAWTDGPIYLALDGFLTQTAPVLPAAFLMQIAASDGPTALVFNPRTPIQL